ncbi:5,6-dimethylbenzimidazole synthase [Nocardia sp. NPDC024068]|uniref:5,6-dimethylbenzimidazole synthase n=1 Tax=Nocardia sp. NPDC024068 TaxID=3157197 RepID=UPI0033F21CBC
MDTVTVCAAEMTVYEAIRTRRDVRAEFTGEPIDEATLWRILAAAHCAPSVGNSQPWDFVLVRNSATLRKFAAHVAEKRLEFARSLPAERTRTFEPIKIEGIEESATGIVVTHDDSRGGPHVLGRATVPETGVYSTILAIQNLWLAATAEQVGVGWVSFYDAAFLAELIELPAHMRPVAWLCIGPVTEFQRVPDLERFGWRDRRPLTDAVYRESYGERRTE